MNILIQNGRIFDANQSIDYLGWMHIVAGKIEAFGPGNPPAFDKKNTEVDATGMLVTPGFIDLHVHLREPGQESKETIESGSNAAVAGGFSSIVCMPNTSPAIDNISTVKFILLEANRVGKANVLPAGTISQLRQGQELAEIGELIAAGCVAITDDGSPVVDSQLMKCALEYTKMFNIPVMDHCEDPALTGKGAMNEGFYSTKLGLRGIPSASEDVMIARDILLAEYTGGKIHIQHLSTTGGVRMIREAKKRGVNITCEVTPHHLLLTDANLTDFDTNFKMSPPLRTKKDQQALIEGLADGTIDAIATDHAPHTLTNKDVEFDFAPNGVIGLETALPAVCHALLKTEKVSLGRIVDALTKAPASIIGCDHKGTIKIGADADITIWNPTEEVTINPDDFYSKARNCPFNAMQLSGKVHYTIVNGSIKYKL